MITVSGCVFSSAAARNVRHMKSFLLGFGAAQAKFDLPQTKFTLSCAIFCRFSPVLVSLLLFMIQ